jgi:flagellar biosynthesis/type III secretory pathway protein FliH
MNKEEFVQWINNLDLQTLTDELKEEIICNAEEAFAAEFAYGHGEGYSEAKDYIVNHIQSEM